MLKKILLLFMSIVFVLPLYGAEFGNEEQKGVEGLIEAVPEKDLRIFFDIGGVLLAPSMPYVTWNLGTINIAKYLVHYRTIPSRKVLQKRLFDYMALVTGLEANSTITSCGYPMPGILYNWMLGELPASEILHQLHTYEHKDVFFDSDAERDLILASADTMKEDVYIGLLAQIPEMVQLFRECLEKYPGQVYILSNWGGRPSRAMIDAFPDVFAGLPADHIIFSNEVACAKPNQDIFNIAAQRAGLDCEKSTDKDKMVLIDDGLENIHGITAWGGYGILYSNPEQARVDIGEHLGAIKQGPVLSVLTELSEL